MYKVKVKGQGQTLKPYISGTIQATEMILTSFERYDPKESIYVQGQGQKSRSKPLKSYNPGTVQGTEANLASPERYGPKESFYA